MNGEGGGASVNGALVAVSVPATKLSVRAPRLPLMRRSTNVTTPDTALTDVVPLSVPPPDASTADTVVALEVTRFPAASWTSRTGCVVNGTPTTAPAGCVRIASCRTAPGVTVTLTLAVAEPLVAVI